VIHEKFHDLMADGCELAVVGGLNLLPVYALVVAVWDIALKSALRTLAEVPVASNNVCEFLARAKHKIFC
jgi:hypothetical protein